MSQLSLLSLTNAHVNLGTAKPLDGVDLDLHAGDFMAILGPNGAGKTTLARALLGLMPLMQGEARIGAARAHALSPRERARRVAYLPQARPLAWPISVRETVALGRFAYGAAQGRLAASDRDAIDRALAACSIEHLQDRAVTTLSGGETARVHIARALASETPALIADEPVGALDPLHQWRIMQTIAAFTAQGGAALVVLHDIALAARFCTRLVLMRAGRVLASGRPQDTLTKENLSAVYGVDVAIGALEGAPAIAVLGAGGGPV